MNKVQAMLPEVKGRLPAGWDLELIWQGAMLTLPNGRKQRVLIKRQDDRYMLSSVALGAARVAYFDRADVLKSLWQINREVGVVGFMLDRHARLVGRIDQLADSLDAAELALYLQLLARECDRLEYVWSGYDIV